MYIHYEARYHGHAMATPWPWSMTLAMAMVKALALALALTTGHGHGRAGWIPMGPWAPWTCPRWMLWHKKNQI